MDDVTTIEGYVFHACVFFDLKGELAHQVKETWQTRDTR